MLARKYRLRNRHDINRVYKRAQPVHTDHLAARGMPNRLGHPRIAVVVSTKIAKSAVKRNRMRRRLFGLIEDHLDTLGGRDIIITVKQDASELPAGKLQAEIVQALTKR